MKKMVFNKNKKNNIGNYKELEYLLCDKALDIILLQQNVQFNAYGKYIYHFKYLVIG
jgi:hypothetical protein